MNQSGTVETVLSHIKAVLMRNMTVLRYRAGQRLGMQKGADCDLVKPLTSLAKT